MKMKCYLDVRIFFKKDQWPVLGQWRDRNDIKENFMRIEFSFRNFDRLQSVHSQAFISYVRETNSRLKVEGMTGIT